MIAIKETKGKVLVKAIIVIAISCGALFAPKSNAAASASNIFFWIGSKYNQVLDSGTTNFIGNHAGLVVLNVRPSSSRSKYDYSNIVKRIRASGLGPMVLMYTWATRDYHSVRIGSEVLSGYDKLGPLILSAPDRRAMEKAHLIGFGDVTKLEYRKWVAKKIVTALGATGTNGVLIDTAVRTPFNLLLPLCTGTNFCEAYAAGMDALFARLQTQLNSKILIYNGIWSKTAKQFNDQTKLLKYSSGAAIEFFGRYQKSSQIPSFKEGILQYLNVIKSYPNKTFLVLGRGPVGYENYRADYLWQRYLYCAFLMVERSNTYFHYNATMQIPSSGRAGALAWYRDWDVPLGKAEGPYKKVNGVYTRKFTNALALLLPRGAKLPVIYRLNGIWYTPTGQRVGNSIKLKPGDSVLLSRIRLSQVPPPDLSAIVRRSKHQGSEYSAYPQSDVITRAWQSDLMLDREHALHAPQCAILSVKTNDPLFRLVMVASIDDRLKRYERVAVVISGDARKDKVTLGPIVEYRIASGERAGEMPYISSTVNLKSDGKLHNVMICGHSLFGARSRFVFDQWRFLRVFGRVDIKAVYLEDANN